MSHTNIVEGMGRDGIGVHDDQIVNFVKQQRAVVAQEVAREFGIATQTARNKLNKLASVGRIDRKKPSSRAVIYFSCKGL